MASGIVNILGTSSTQIYSANSLGKCRLNWAGTSTNLTVTQLPTGSAVVVATGSAAVPYGQVEFYVAPGQSVQIGTGGAMTCIVSALEELT